DGWVELSEKDRSALKKSRVLAHAREIYEGALPDATALLRAKIEKRLKELEATTAPPPIDLLKRIDPAKDALKGVWKLEGSALISPIEKYARIQLPYIAPEEFDLRLVVERKKKASDVFAGGFYIGIVRGERQFGIELDRRCNQSAIMMIDGKGEGVPGADYHGSALPEE